MPQFPNEFHLPNGPSVDAEAVKRVSRFGCGVLVLLFFGVFVLAAVRPYTEYLWFAFDARTPQVFSTAYGTRGTLFVAAFIPALVVLYLSLRTALGISLVYSERPTAGATQLVSNALGWLQQRGLAIVKIVSPVIAFLAASGFSNEWNTWLLARHVQSFGVKDPTYGLDLGFYVFTLPWWRASANFAFGTLLTTTVLTVGIYIGVQSLAAIAKAELSRPKIRTHLSVLIALTLAAAAAQFFLKTYESGLIENAQFTGAGYADARQIVAERICAILMALVALGTLANARLGKPYAAPIGGAVLVGAWYLLGVTLWPVFVQRFEVDPDRFNKEALFASRAIAMSRFGYDLNKVQVKDFAVKPVATPQEVLASSATTDNIRLWDPDVLRMALQNLQGNRSYYRFSDVDIDRYTFGGKETMVMVSPRDADIDNLDPTARNWTNERLRYTHGYGVVVTQVNAATEDGRPVFLSQGIPQSTSSELPIVQPRIYYSDIRDSSNLPIDEYTIVNTKVDELDYQTSDRAESHRWTETRGIPIGSLLPRLSFAIRLGDGNLLVSSNVTGDSRLLMRRNVGDRASHMYPFLHFDADPYLVILNGRLIWVLDGYTTSDMVPYSAMSGDESGRFNYIRNPVKVTVDAYTGETNAYAVDSAEPLLKAYRAIYPNLVKDASALPPGLAEHLRYPEDLLTSQSRQLGQYHVSDPVAFLGNADAWDVAYQRGHSGGKEPMRPYYVQMKLPDEPAGGFVQILPFATHNKPNMSGWLAAHCDPGSYGKLTMYRFTEGALPPGPELMESNFVTDPQVSYINRTYQNQQSEIIVGNLLVVPIGQSVMYIESLYLHSTTEGVQAAPRLFRVILAFADRVAVGDNYRDAYQKLFGAAAATAQPTTPPSSTPANPAIRLDRAEIRKALDVLSAADQALRQGDFAKYGELQKQLKARLRQLAGVTGP